MVTLNVPVAAFFGGVTVALADCVPPNSSEFGFTAQLDPGSVLLHVRETVPVNPLTGLTVTVYDALFPPETVCEAGETEREKSLTVSVKFWVASVPTPLCAVKVIG